MNLTPSDLTQFMVLGDLNELPTSGQWPTILLLSHEILLWLGADRKCLFFIWFSPCEWRRLLAFSKRVPGLYVGRPDEALVQVCSAMMTMGWLSAVSIIEHLFRNQAAWSHSLDKGMPPAAEVRRDAKAPWSPFREHNRAWQLFIDNTDVMEIFGDFSKNNTLLGSDCEWLLGFERFWEEIGAPGNPDQLVMRSADHTSLGVRIMGIEGRL